MQSEYIRVAIVELLALLLCFYLDQLMQAPWPRDISPQIFLWPTIKQHGWNPKCIKEKEHASYHFLHRNGRQDMGAYTISLNKCLTKINELGHMMLIRWSDTLVREASVGKVNCISKCNAAGGTSLSPFLDAPFWRMGRAFFKLPNRTLQYVKINM
jgi:hypothetical protein